MDWIRMFLVLAILVGSLGLGCGADTPAGPSTGSVSGTITFRGGAPEEQGQIFVGLFAAWPPVGSPIRRIELSGDEGMVQYALPRVVFGTYEAVAVSRCLPGQMNQVLGAAGLYPPEDMDPEAVTVSRDDPDQTGVDIFADYTAPLRWFPSPKTVIASQKE